ncbi:MAG: hypothetical protein JW942_01440 [Opitutales bacterium]|nr:hypothetical protein [Opitutales bacterium]
MSDTHAPVPENTATQAEPPSDLKQTLRALYERLPLRGRPRLVAWLLGLAFVVIMAQLENKRVAMCEAVIVPVAPDAQVPIHRQQIIPDPDGIRWVILSQQAASEHTLRIPHWTNADNHPDGRFVGWSSPPMWWLRTLGAIRSLTTGEDTLTAISKAAPYANNYLWILGAAGIGALCVSGIGKRGAFIIPILYALLAATKYGSYSPDHHLWMLFSALGMLICLCSPFVREGQGGTRRWFAGAALFMTLGLWISAPSQALVLIGIYLGLLFLPAEAARKVPAENWRLFGTLSALLSLAIGQWEFWPRHIFYVELNNPIYSLGCYVAGIWLWQTHTFAAADRRWDSLSPRPLVYSGLVMFAAALPVIVYLPYLYSLADPYHARWVEQIMEDQPIDIQSFILEHLLLITAFSAALYGLISNWGKLNAGKRALLITSGTLGLSYGYFAISANRFSDILILCITTALCLGLCGRRTNKAGTVAAILTALLLISSLHKVSTATRNAKVYGTQASTLGYAVNLRGIAEAILALEPDPAASILAPSNESNFLNYYTGKPVYGTAYWENNEGLKFICRVFYYEDADENTQWPEVRKLLKEKDVKLIYLPKNFSYDSSYMIYGLGRIEDPRHSFAHYLLKTPEDKIQAWLKLEKDHENYRIFRVVE